MKINHIALWVKNLEKMKKFYENYFQGTAGEKYHNPKKQFESYFISFAGGCRLELMHNPNIPRKQSENNEQHLGLIHFAISVGSKKQVDELTERLRKDRYHVIGEPRTTGDGCYESVLLDPEGNRIEITE
jgi:lactoylglutathione lyase